MSWILQAYVSLYIFVFGLIDGADPNATIPWLHLFYYLLGIVWIGYQFNRLRRRSAREFDRWVQDQTTRLRRNFEVERREYLEQVMQDAHFSIWWRTALMIVARTKLVLQFILRVLLLRRWKPSVAYAMTLWRAGRQDKAHAQFLAMAADFQNRLPTYGTLEAAKRLKARNVFLYAGLSAAEMPQATNSYDTALRLSENTDVEAYRLLARQALDGPHPINAMVHGNRMVELGNEIHDELLTAEGLRLEAEATGIRTRQGRHLLEESLRLELANRNYRGIARSQELIGDIFARRAGSSRTAARWYNQSLQNYGWGNDWVSEKRIQQKLNRLLGRETRISRFLDRLARAIQKLAMRMRGPPQT